MPIQRQKNIYENKNMKELKRSGVHTLEIETEADHQTVLVI